MQTDLIERIRITTQISQAEWCDLLNIQWSDYQRFKAGHLALSEKSIEAIAQNFKLALEELEKGEIDFQNLALESQSEKLKMPERYLKAAYGRRRSSIAAVQYLEDEIGWRLRTDVVQKFKMPEAELLNPFSNISILFMTDLCEYLHRRGFKAQDYVQMGGHGQKLNADSLIGRHWASLRHVGEVYESFLQEAIVMFEENCNYTLAKLIPTGGVIEVRSNPDVSAETGVRHLGSSKVCSFKAGFFASLAAYQGLKWAHVRETACEHKGDSCCRFEFTYQPKSESQLNFSSAFARPNIA